VFSLCCLKFPIRSPSSQCVPQHVLHITSLLSHMIQEKSICCPHFTYIGEPKGRNSILQNRTLYFGQHSVVGMVFLILQL
jgi:hypothetical protein